jgi:maleate isomerase
MSEMTVGVLTPHSAPGPDVELPALSEGRVRTVVVRAGSSTQLSASTKQPALQEAASIFRSSAVDAVVHASTTTGYLIGADKEALLVDELARLCGVPAFASCAAAVSALRAGGAERIQLVHPPWFTDGFDVLGVEYFQAHDLHAVATRARELPNDPALIEPHHVIDWLDRHQQDKTDGIYLAGNGFRTAAAVDELKQRTGKVVVSANGALLEAVLSSSH